MASHAASLSTVVADNVTVASAPSLVSNCPAPWTCADVGSPDATGLQSLDGTTWTVQGAGLDIWNAADQFHYVWQPLAGDGSMSAQVITQNSTGGWAKAGIMFRQDQTASAAFYMVALTPENGITVQYRTDQGTDAQMNIQFAGTAPVYLEAIRTGDIYTAATSSDGVTWIPVAGSAVTLNTHGALLVGLEVDSTAVQTLSTATFTNVQMTSTSGSTPTPTPTPTATPSGTQPYAVYDEALAPGWGDWSWCSNNNLADTTHPNTGSYNISWAVTCAYGGLALHLPSGFNTTGYTSLTFTLRASQPGQRVQISLYDSGGNTGSPVQLDSYGGTPVAGGYTVYTIPLSVFQSTTTITGILIQDITSNATEPPMYVDTIEIV